LAVIGFLSRQVDHFGLLVVDADTQAVARS